MHEAPQSTSKICLHYKIGDSLYTRSVQNTTEGSQKSGNQQKCFCWSMSSHLLNLFVYGYGTSSLQQNSRQSCLQVNSNTIAAAQEAVELKQILPAMANRGMKGGKLAELSKASTAKQLCMSVWAVNLVEEIRGIADLFQLEVAKLRHRRNVNIRTLGNKLLPQVTKQRLTVQFKKLLTQNCVHGLH